MAGLTAFREAYMAGEVQNEQNWSDFGARRLRYSILWAFYENNAYRSMNAVHTWAGAYRDVYGLYKYTRNIYNPSYRIGEFWRAHLLGGMLDPAAGDGQARPSALPILTENEDIRPTLAQIWRQSNWQISKDILTLWGAVMGDAAITVNDDPARQRVTLRVIHPSTIKSMALDDYGNVKGYVLEEQRDNPDKPGDLVTYTEIASRERDDPNVYYQTLKDGKPYSWNGIGAEWSKSYGFIPMVNVMHDNIGLGWGRSELHAGMSKIREADDMASLLDDQIRKSVNAVPVFIGAKRDEQNKKISSGSTASTETQGEGARQQTPALYIPDPAGKIDWMVAPLKIGEVSAHIKSILESLERDYPELTIDVRNASGEMSGRALRAHQKPVEDRVKQRRVNYDDAIIRAQAMAISIGAQGGYPGFEKFTPESYGRGELEHAIGERPVFGEDPLDKIDIEQAFWTAANQARAYGIPVISYLRRHGWSDEDITDLESSSEYQARISALKNSALMNDRMDDQANGE